MQIDAVTLVTFSPTGTTRAVLQGIARGLGADLVTHLDLTLPDAEERRPVTLEQDLVLIGAPVYAGRIPTTAAARFLHLTGKRTPAGLVVVYGNRAYEDALLELSDLARARGFVPVAGAAFIGEHSYSSAETPIAVGRPDAQDLDRAAQFGRAIAARLRAIDAAAELPPLRVPGDRPYRRGMGTSEVAPATDVERCTLCGRCAEVCPVGAIDVEDTVLTDACACILCCACVKVCPTDARSMLDEGVRRTARWLAEEHAARKEPETFIA